MGSHGGGIVHSNTRGSNAVGGWGGEAILMIAFAFIYSPPLFPLELEFWTFVPKQEDAQPSVGCVGHWSLHQVAANSKESLIL